MATKYAEGLLAIRYRTKDDNGHISGGPMYYILFTGWERSGDHWLFLCGCRSVGGPFGIGTMTQVNSITDPFCQFWNSSRSGYVVIAWWFPTIIFWRDSLISKVSEKVVPFMAAAYIFATITIIALHLDQLFPALKAVFSGAFTGLQPWEVSQEQRLKWLSKGVARGVFSNESGLGSAPIAAAAAKTNEPVEQGLISMTGTFIDTIIICSLDRDFRSGFR